MRSLNRVTELVDLFRTGNKPTRRFLSLKKVSYLHTNNQSFNDNNGKGACGCAEAGGLKLRNVKCHKPHNEAMCAVCFCFYS